MTLRLFAWLGVASLLVPWSLEVFTGPGAFGVYVYWALVGIQVASFQSVNLFFTPFAFWFGPNSLFSVTVLTYLSEFALLVMGCVLLFRRKRIGGVAFILAALFETTVLLYSMAFPPSSFIGVFQVPFHNQAYYLPIGAVLSAIIGVGSLVLTAGLSKVS
jgi:hypothetical protein